MVGGLDPVPRQVKGPLLGRRPLLSVSVAVPDFALSSFFPLPTDRHHLRSSSSLPPLDLSSPSLPFNQADEWALGAGTVSDIRCTQCMFTRAHGARRAPGVLAQAPFGCVRRRHHVDGRPAIMAGYWMAAGKPSLRQANGPFCWSPQYHHQTLAEKSGWGMPMPISAFFPRAAGGEIRSCWLAHGSSPPEKERQERAEEKQEEDTHRMDSADAREGVSERVTAWAQPSLPASHERHSKDVCPLEP